MYIAEDESLFSLLFRISEVSGLNDIQSLLIGNNGCWLSRPIWPKSYIYLLDSVSDIELLNLVERSGLGEPLSVFDSPEVLIYGLKSIFEVESFSFRQRRGAIPITFCIDCIQDSIRENGFGYLTAGQANCRLILAQESQKFHLVGIDQTKGIAYAIRHARASELRIWRLDNLVNQIREMGFGDLEVQLTKKLSL